MSTAPLEYRTDVAGGRAYASRNYAHLRHVYQSATANTSNFEWCNTLRQVRAGQLKPPEEKKDKGTQSMPDLRTAVREKTDRGPMVSEHSEGPYLGSTKSVGKYQTFSHVKHLVDRYSPNELDWMLNLRGSIHAEDPSSKWRRFHTRPQQSFDMMRENCSKDNEAYQRSHITPQDRRIDRRTGAIPIENIRADPISFKRWEGCEGTNVSLWRHMMDDHRRGYKVRRAIQAETTFRLDPNDPNGAKVCDNRNDGCVVEMLGKKRWNGAEHHDPMHARPPHGDPKLHYLGQMRPMLERNEENRRMRMQRQPRTDNVDFEAQPDGQ